MADMGDRVAIYGFAVVAHITAGDSGGSARAACRQRAMYRDLPQHALVGAQIGRIWLSS